MTADVEDEFYRLPGDPSRWTRTTTSSTTALPAGPLRGIIVEVDRKGSVDLMDVSPRMMTWSLPRSSRPRPRRRKPRSLPRHPVLDHDDANRAPMGANMQRQAIPLMVTEADRCHRHRA